MKKLVLLLLAVICIFTSCGKNETSSRNSDQIEWEELEKVYAYETPFVFSQERVENKVEYIKGMDSLVDEAVKIIRTRMRSGHYTGDWGNEVWTAWDTEDDIGAFDGKGYYICRIPITTYNNNRNTLLESFSLLIFNEDKSITGKVSFGNLNSRTLKVEIMVPSSEDFIIPKAMPDMEFINIHANFNMYGDDVSNPSGWTFASYPLGDNNIVYARDYYSGKIKELNKLNLTLFKGRSWSVEGDLFHSLPEEMRYSYDKIMDNLIWVEY
ncbi:MAG: hypothetical protein HDT13_00875 [Butyrivibrio sp.]|nr:hypothetical protein [Butyrivibrio sp.]